MGFRIVLYVAGGMPSDPAMREVLVSAASAAEQGGAAVSKLPPALHVYGQADQVISPEKSLEMARLWGPTAVLCSHPGGHMIPSAKGFRDEVCAFVRDSLSATPVDVGGKRAMGAAA